MTKQEAIEQLKSLKKHCETMYDDENDRSVFDNDVDALEMAIAALEKQNNSWRKGNWDNFREMGEAVPFTDEWGKTH